MEDYKFFQFFMNIKLITAFLCLESHICNEAAGIRVKPTHTGINFNKYTFCIIKTSRAPYLGLVL
jgi:hypothetical protein